MEMKGNSIIEFDNWFGKAAEYVEKSPGFVNWWGEFCSKQNSPFYLDKLTLQV